MQTQFSLDLEFATSLLSEGLAQANQQEALLNVEEQNIDFNISNMLLTHCIQLPGFIQIFGSITQDFFETFFQNNNFFFQTFQNLPFRKFQPEKRLPKVIGDLFRVKIRLSHYTIFRCLKILGEAGKQEILQRMFRKF